MTRFLILIAKRNDLLLAILLVSIIFMMVLPLPTHVVDMLIAVNLSLTVLLLMVAVYLSDVTHLSAFPSILLLTTLFRLALSITTTRLILLNGNAGEIIATFGKFVVGGNVIVGMVAFLILTIVNFLVITKGSERVAEVSARFSLDSMPGKQMAIDSDMRAGMIVMDEAKKRRSRLEKESQLYAAMDGAMKFVKGDAIASIIIIAGNLIGGISIGVLQKDMSASDAANLYALLTVGDGLVAQIPALFVSMTAGFIVTRVSSEDGRDLGSDIFIQLIGEPRGLLVTSAILVLFAMVPGFPPIIFLALALLTGVGGYIKLRMDRQRIKNMQAGDINKFSGGYHQSFQTDQFSSAETKDLSPSTFDLSVPIILDLAPNINTAINQIELKSELSHCRNTVFTEFGVPIPEINIRINQTLNAEYCILINEITVASGQIMPGFAIVRESESSLKTLKVPFGRGPDFLPDIPSFWVQNRYLPEIQHAGFIALTSPEIIGYHVTNTLKLHVSEFIGIQETMHVLTQMQENYPDLVKETARLLSVTTISDVLQRLVQEDIAIRDMRTILEALVRWGQREKDPIMLCEHVRGALGRYIINKFSHGLNIIPAYILSKEIEDIIRDAIRQTSGASYLALAPDMQQDITNAVRKAVGKKDQHSSNPVILAPMDIRRFTRKMIESEFPNIPVLSYQELSPNTNIQALDRITLIKNNSS